MAARLPLFCFTLHIRLQIQCFCLSTGELLGNLTGHKRAVHSLSFDSTGRTLLSASVDTAIIWNITDWSRLRTLGAGSGIVQVCATINVSVFEFTIINARLRLQAEFLPDQDAIGCVFRDNTIIVWSSISYAVLARLTLPDTNGTSPSTVACFAASSDGAYFIAGTRNGTLLVWDLTTQALVRVVDMPMPAQVVSQCVFLHDNTTAAVLCDDGHVVILTAAAPSCKALLDISAPDRVRLPCSVVVAVVRYVIVVFAGNSALCR